MEEPSLAAGTRVIKKSQVHVTGSSGVAPGPGQPSVQIREEGGKIRALEVHCPCGGKILIDLEFSPSDKKE